MTRKHFIELANTLKANKPTSDEKSQTWECIVRDVASFCARQNTNFDYGRFYKACGL